MVTGLNQTYSININPALTVSNLKASISAKTNIAERHFKLIQKQQYLTGNNKIKDLGLKSGDQIEIKLGIRGG